MPPSPSTRSSRYLPSCVPGASATRRVAGAGVGGLVERVASLTSASDARGHHTIRRERERDRQRHHRDRRIEQVIVEQAEQRRRPQIAEQVDREDHRGHRARAQLGRHGAQADRVDRRRRQEQPDLGEEREREERRPASASKNATAVSGAAHTMPIAQMRSSALMPRLFAGASYGVVGGDRRHAALRAIRPLTADDRADRAGDAP